MIFYPNNIRGMHYFFRKNLIKNRRRLGAGAATTEATVETDKNNPFKGDLYD